jgi:hypothetical protein
MTENDLSNIHFYIQGIMNRFYIYVNICDIPERWWHFIKIQCQVIILCIHGEMLFWTAVLRTALAEHLYLLPACWHHFCKGCRTVVHTLFPKQDTCTATKCQIKNSGSIVYLLLHIRVIFCDRNVHEFHVIAHRYI